MPCRWTKLPDGTVVHVNMGRGRAKKCIHCGRAADKLCDGPLPDGTVHRRRTSVAGADTTCSKPICGRCAIHVAPDSDYCRDHRQAALDHAARLRGQEAL